MKRRECEICGEKRNVWEYEIVINRLRPPRPTGVYAHYVDLCEICLNRIRLVLDVSCKSAANLEQACMSPMEPSERK